MRLRKAAPANGFVNSRIERSAVHIARNAPRRRSALFNSRPAASGENDYRSPSGVINGEREKKFAVDIDLLFNQYRFDWKVSHFHRQHPLSMRTHVIWLFGESDSADTSAPGGPRLDFNDYFAAKFLGRCYGFIGI